MIGPNYCGCLSASITFWHVMCSNCLQFLVGPTGEQQSKLLLVEEQTAETVKNDVPNSFKWK